MATYAIFVLAAGAIGIWIAMIMGKYVQRLMDAIWKDPAAKDRTKVVKRVRELCVDGSVPNETSILIAAKELNMTEEHIRDALEGLSPQMMKTLAKGDALSAFLRATMKLTNKVKGSGDS